MNIDTYSSFEKGAKEQILKDNWKLYDFINQELKSRIPIEHFYKLRLRIKEYKGKYFRKSIEANNKLAEGEYYARAGGKTDPYKCQVMMNYFDLKRYWDNMSFVFDLLKERGEIDSFLEAYYYVFFHELGHLIIFFNNFEKYIEFLDKDHDRENTLENYYVEEGVATEIGDELFDLWKEIMSDS